VLSTCEILYVPHCGLRQQQLRPASDPLHAEFLPKIITAILEIKKNSENDERFEHTLTATRYVQDVSAQTDTVCWGA
jgi:hypothetical protein